MTDAADVFAVMERWPVMSAYQTLKPSDVEYAAHLGRATWDEVPEERRAHYHQQGTTQDELLWRDIYSRYAEMAVKRFAENLGYVVQWYEWVPYAEMLQRLARKEPDLIFVSYRDKPLGKHGLPIGVKSSDRAGNINFLIRDNQLVLRHIYIQVSLAEFTLARPLCALKAFTWGKNIHYFGKSVNFGAGPSKLLKLDHYTVRCPMQLFWFPFKILGENR